MLNLAGETVKVSLDPACREAHVDARFGAFYTGEGAAAWEVSVEVLPRWRVPEGAGIFPGVGVRREGARWVFVRSTDVTTLDPETRRVTVQARASGHDLAPVEDPTPLDTPLRLLVAYSIVRRQGFLLHAAGYRDAARGGALVFAAVSGGGKTTTARKLPHAGVLSDDQVAIVRAAGGFEAHALPFVGEYRRATAPGASPLKRVVLLGKAEAPARSPVRPREAATQLARCAVYFARGDAAVGQMFNTVLDVCEQVPVERWSMPRDFDVAPWVDAVLG
ncbi:MAG: hypothetical protein JNK72_19835 [Myxococcales bacterium]|nr:hypothetical protein [Myxococcales bacterium]